MEQRDGLAHDALCAFLSFLSFSQCSRLRTLLKTAKKKLRDQDAAPPPRSSQGEGGFGHRQQTVGQVSLYICIRTCLLSILVRSFGLCCRAEQASQLCLNNLPNHCGCLSCCPSVPPATQPSGQVEELQAQLEKEASRRSQLERTNGELKEQLASLSSLGHSSEQLERSRRQLEEELLELRRRLEAEHGQAERYRHDVEERARQEVQQKLEQVNLFLQVRPGGS